MRRVQIPKFSGITGCAILWMCSITGLTGIVTAMAKTTRISLICTIRTIIILNTTLIIHNKPWMTWIASTNCYPEVINHNGICPKIWSIARVKTVVLSCIHTEVSIMSSTRVQWTNSKKHSILTLISILRTKNSRSSAITE